MLLSDANKVEELTKLFPLSVFFVTDAYRSKDMFEVSHFGEGRGSHKKKGTLWLSLFASASLLRFVLTLEPDPCVYPRGLAEDDRRRGRPLRVRLMKTKRYDEKKSLSTEVCLVVCLSLSLAEHFSLQGDGSRGPCRGAGAGSETREGDLRFVFASDLSFNFFQRSVSFRFLCGFRVRRRCPAFLALSLIWRRKTNDVGSNENGSF